MLSQEEGNFNQKLERYKERITNFSNEFEIGLFLYLARKSLGTALILLTVSVACAFLYIRYTAPTYEASAVIQVDDSEQAKQVLEVSSIHSNKLAAKLEVLRSKVLLKKALMTLPLKVSYFGEGKLLTFEHYTSSAYRVKLVDSSGYNKISMRRIDVKFDKDMSVEVSYKRKNGENFSKKFPDIQNIVLPDGRLEMRVLDLDRLVKLQENNSLYFRINDFDKLAKSYHKNLKVNVLSQSAKTIHITFTNHHPEKCRDLVSALANSFAGHEEERKKQSSKNILQFINDQLDSVYHRLRDSEMAIQNYKRDNKLVSNMEGLTNIYLERLNSYEEEVATLTIEENFLKKIERTIAGEASELDVYQLIPLMIGTSYEGTLQVLVNDLHSTLVRKEQLLYDFTKESEEIKAINFEMTIKKDLIMQSIANIRSKTTDDRNIAEAQLDKHAIEFDSLPGKELEYQRMRRIFAINEKFYTMLLEKSTEYKISNAGYVADIDILEKAVVPKTPLSPRPNLVYLTFILLGVLFSLIVIVIRYIFHNNITSLNEIMKITNASMSILGIIPKYKRDIPVSQLLIDKNPKSLIAESFRMVRSNLQFISNEPGPKLMAVTSTISGEGKTFVAINLAGIIAFSEKKVIVLDLDLRKPKIHLGFNAENTLGMSTLLIGKDTIDNCIRNSDLDNLDFITAGPIPPNPSELIINGKLKEIIAELKTRYDYVIIDNPPVGLVTDGISIIQMADYPVYIFRANYSKKHFVQNVDRLMNENKINKLSVILNGVDSARTNYGYNYGYSYGYGYGYGYGSGSGYHNYYDEDVDDTKTSLWSRIFKRKRK